MKLKNAILNYICGNSPLAWSYIYMILTHICSPMRNIVYTLYHRFIIHTIFLYLRFLSFFLSELYFLNYGNTIISHDYWLQKPIHKVLYKFTISLTTNQSSIFWIRLLFCKLFEVMLSQNQDGFLFFPTIMSLT